METAVVIPALDEEATLPAVLGRLTSAPVDVVIVADNGSRDRTVDIAQAAGAIIVSEPRRGYGAACLAGLAWCRRHGPPRQIAFLDADGSDDPGDLPRLLAPLIAGEADLVIGARREVEPGALQPAQRFGNALAVGLISLLTAVRFSDLGPFRAVRWESLERLDMRDRDFGWTVEMQLKAARAGLRCREIEVPYRRRRGGKSKVAGTVRGSVAAGAIILSTLLRYRGWRPLA